MMMVPAKRLLTVALLGTWCSAHAIDFLGQREQVTKEFVEQTLDELVATTGSARLAAIQQELSPMYASLPKNEQGQLESSTVRYALHRYFVQKHGWYVQGFSPTGSALTNSSSATIVTEMAPVYLQALLEKQLHGAGMQLQDLAVFAATLSDLVHSEGVKHLHAVYEILELPTAGDVSLASFNSAVRGYLAATVVGDFGPKFVDARGLENLERVAREFYAEYDDLLMWFEDARLTRDFMDVFRRNPFQVKAGISPGEADALMRELYHKFGSLNNLECVSVKNKLVAAEYPGTGRVSLAKFYASDLDLQESVAYLRNQGALDETNTESPALVIPNYMSSPSRCMPFSSYFSVCCPDDCESVLGRIEEALAEPSADPKRIVDIVSSTASDTQEAPRNLSTTLLARLDGIAGRHQGRVPLHGRLFMQWMHHAYPRECPYPHVSGTINAVTQDDWMNMHHDIDDVGVTESEKKLHATSHVHDLASLEPLPWSDVEELVAAHQTERSFQSRSYLRSVMMVVAVLSFIVPLVRGSAALMGNQPLGKDQMQMHLV